MGTKRSLGQGFRALFVGSLVSNIGDGIRLSALPLLAASLTSSKLLIAAVTAAQYLPWVTFAPAGGALVDRWDRRRTILITQAWRGLVVGGLALLVWTSHAEIWQVWVVAFAITVGEILVDPSTVALVPTLVGDDNLDRANGRISSVEIITNDFAGGPVGAALFSLAPWLPFLIDGATYLGSLLPFRRLPRAEPQPQTEDTPPRSLRAEAREGFSWLRHHTILGPLTLAQVVYYFGLAASLSLLVVLVTDELNAPTAAFGLVLAVGAAGAFLGTLVGAPLAARFGARLSLSGAVALQAVTLGAAAATPSLPVLAGLWFLNGIPAGAQRPIARSLQQRLTPNDLLGRVNVTTRIFTRGIIVIGALAAGTLATFGGVRSSFALGGVAQLVAAAMMWKALGRLPSAPTHGSQQPRQDG
ncbi:MAG: MFS transporter [Actinomycetia bacterium]|nr:MFS transporter [Actinomycetes bacterium]MCP4959717.1 MFS transporter [Actinomycetes bacterium]